MMSLLTNTTSRLRENNINITVKDEVYSVYVFTPVPHGFNIKKMVSTSILAYVRTLVVTSVGLRLFRATLISSVALQECDWNC